MKFAYTILYVADVSRSLAFYGQAFGFTTRFLHEGGDYGELDTGATTLAFASRNLLASMGKNPQAPDANAPVSEIALTTSDVPSAVAQALSSGAGLIQGPKEMPWGQTIAYVADLDGFMVELCTPMA